jgi:MarR family transcriptional regulator, lower aerobic nicotinate degradation pathway regulator
MHFLPHVFPKSTGRPGVLRFRDQRSAFEHRRPPATAPAFTRPHKPHFLVDAPPRRRLPSQGISYVDVATAGLAAPTMTRGHDIAMGLRAAYWAVHRRSDAVLERHGVTADQFVLLSLLSEAEGGITQQELVRRASSDPNTVRAMLVLLERLRLVSRRPHPTDGRARLVTLSPKGRRALQRLWSASESLRDRLAGVFSDEEAADAVVRGLRRIADEMAPDPARRTRPRRRRRRVAAVSATVDA